MKKYTSYFNYDLREPLYVKYKLYKGGGSNIRTDYFFITGGIFNSATSSDYKLGIYDKGHLANAEDFSYSQELLLQTFYYFNCVPQTPKLNRGIWKKFEFDIRKLSQSDSLFIFAGSIFGTKRLNNIAIPDKCWKIVYSLSKKKIIYCLIFNNDNSNTYENITYENLKKQIKYKVDWSTSNQGFSK